MTHIHDKIDFTVGVFIVYNKKVLLRKHDKYGIWLAVGGHIELDEDPNQAALREVKEEVGLDVELWDTRGYKDEHKGFKELINPVGLNRHLVSDTHEHIDFTYFARAKTDVVTPENATDEWRWCAKDEIDALGCPDNVPYYAKLAIDSLG